MDDDEELQKVLELSRKSYEEEQRRRNCESPDLLLGDLEEIRRQRDYAEITALFDAPAVPSLPPMLAPRSVATLPYGFKPPYSLYPNQDLFSPCTVIPFPSNHSSRQNSYISMPEPTIPQQLLPVQNSVHINVPPANPDIKMNHSPIIVPFRTFEGKLIDLDDAPAAPPIMTRTTSLLGTSPKSDAHIDGPMIHFDELLALIEGPKEEPVITEPECPPLPAHHREASVSGNLEVIEKENSFTLQCKSLEEKIQKFKNPNEVFFIAPTVDYAITTADSIKLIVYRDESWPRHLSSSPKQVELTYEVFSTCEDLLISVLCRFCPAEDIGKTIKIEDFALKLYGVDEFLEPSSTLGNIPFVAKFLSRGKDVPLQIGQKFLPFVNFQYLKSAFESPQVLKFKFDSDLMKQRIDAINERLRVMDNSQTFTITMRQDLIEKVVDLCKLCYKVQTIEISSCLQTILAAEVESHYKHAKNELIRAIYNLVTMFCEATVTDMSLKPMMPKFETGEIKESRNVNDEFMVYVESMHNLPTTWFQKYQKFYVELRLMYGPNPVGEKQVCDKKYPRNDHNIVSVPFSSWIQLGTTVMMLPRETQLCCMVFGVLKEKEVTKDGNSHQFVGFTYLPLFDQDGFLHQGKALIPLKSSKHGFEIVEPWGARPLIRDKNSTLLVISTVEYPYQIEFPKTIEMADLVQQTFDSLDEKDQSALLDLLDRNVGHHNISKDDKQLLWSNRKALLNMASALVPTLSSAFAWNYLALPHIYALLNKWTVVPPQLALDLLLPYFQDTVVRKKAVDFIKNGSSDFLISLLPQLIESLRFEQFEDSALARFLLEHCTKDRRFATILFWELDHRVMNEESTYSSRCHLLRELIIKLNIPNFAEDISCQKVFLKQLDQICESAKVAQTIAVANSVVQTALYELNEKIMITGLRVPINSGFLATTINVEECGVFNSLTKPLRLNLVGQQINYGVIYKVGDDLRQDAIVLQLVRLMNDMWLRENLDLRMLTYRVLPTAKNRGLIELVNDCKTLREIQVAASDRASDVFKDDTIANWICRHNPSEFNNRTAFENFKRSCAAWSVATYVLGIGDRHNDNILISTAGHVFHIDFGKYMGDWQTAMGFNRDRVPFILTPEMVVAINNGTKMATERFQEFSDYCCRAFNILRKNCSLLLNMIRFMSCSSIPSMNLQSVQFVEKNLKLGLSDSEAATFFTNMIRESVESDFPRFNFWAHTVAQKMAGGGGNQNQEKGEFSFTNEIHTATQDGVIKDIQVVNYEKWKNPSKIYMYVFQIQREKESQPSYIYRSFEEVEELYRTMVRRFGASSLPVLDASSGFGRSNTRQVAGQRKIVLQQFFYRFLQLSNEIKMCDSFYTFFHAIHRDTNPEVVKDTINQGISPTGATAVHLSFCVEKESNILKIFVGHARNLPLIGGTATTPPDSYVKIYVRPDRMENTKRKSDVVRNTCNPTFNTHIEYEFSNIDDMKGSVLDVSIWQCSSAIVRDNYRICGTFIPLEKLFSIQPDRKGTRTFADWFTLAVNL
uniref:Phosphatidylinositol 3-kinase n=1 Tax=Panagrolaimus sp. JU765 TaxID=591449 RepID=A0AC34QE78_9BILA